MRLSIDLDTFAVSDYTGSAVQTLSARRGDVFPVQVRFTQGGVVKELPYAAIGRLAIKNAQDYSGPMVAGSTTWRKIGYGTATYYVFQLSLNTERLSEVFASGEVAQASFVIEIEWAHRGVRQTSRAVAFTVDNDFIQGDEAAPDPAYDPKATEAEAKAGSDNAKYMTPLRVAQTLKAAASQQLALTIALG